MDVVIGVLVVISFGAFIWSLFWNDEKNNREHGL